MSQSKEYAHFVAPAWLAENLRAPDLFIFDASWHLPSSGRNARQEYLAGHIPGAVFFDIDAISDPATDLPHMLPNPVFFSSAMRKLGLGDGMRVVVYDSLGLFSAPRVWWTLRAFGVKEVGILEGGLPAWVAEGGMLEEGAVKRQPRHFTARLNHSAVADLEDVRRALDTGESQIVDARAAARFSGSEAEPRAGVRSGHMPGARNVPWSELVDNGRLKPRKTVLELFSKAGVDLAKPVITTCGSGVSAAILSLAIEEAARKPVPIYDGSWSEWGARSDCAVADGAR